MWPLSPFPFYLKIPFKRLRVEREMRNRRTEYRTRKKVKGIGRDLFLGTIPTAADRDREKYERAKQEFLANRRRS
jgi:hypothetical protein